jgi:glycosyltransferase involved in cell wall biosynthesis
MPGNFLKKILIKKIMYYSILSCDKLIVDSNYAKKEIIKILKIKNKNVKTIYLGLDQKFYNKNNYFFLDNFNYKKPYILSVLSCVKYHNIINILKAFQLINKLKKVETSLVLVMQILDQGYFNEINTYIKKNNLMEKVTIITNVDSKYLLNLYKNAKIYIFSSYSEVFGYTTIEAMACGCPVLVSKKSCLPEINSNAAEYFNPDIINSIVRKILILLYQNNIRKKLIINGLKRAKIFSIKETFSFLSSHFTIQYAKFLIPTSNVKINLFCDINLLNIL